MKEKKSIRFKIKKVKNYDVIACWIGKMGIVCLREQGRIYTFKSKEWFLRRGCSSDECC